MFEKARLKLTAWYMVIILVITGGFSLLFYLRAAIVVQQQHDRLHLRLEGEDFVVPPGVLSPRVNRMLTEDLLEAKSELAKELLIINGVIAVAAGVASYVLAGKTLTPIKRAMEDQKRFVGDAAHELRTPIAALKTTLEVNLMEKKMAPGAKKVFKENLEDVEDLERLSETLLKLAKADGKRMAKEKVRVKALIEAGVKKVGVLAKKKGIPVVVDKIGEEVVVVGDKEVLGEVMTILVDNAIKYSNKGARVRIKARRVNDKVIIEVKDKGVGIAKHHLAHIFERFYRVDSARSRDGYGLGLAVAKKIVEEHGGKIEVESELEKGSEFAVSLPLK